MKTINLSEQNSVLSQYMAEIRDIEYQKNRLLFRNNIRRIGEMMAFEISKALTSNLRLWRPHWEQPIWHCRKTNW